MMAIYLWEVYYLIIEKSKDKPVMAAYNFVMSEDFKLWNKLNPVDLNEGIYRVVNDYVPTLDFSDRRVRKFAEALSMISGSSDTKRLPTYNAAPPFNSDSDTESEYEDSDSDSSYTSVDGGPESGLIELKYANDAIEMVLRIVHKRNPELHSSLFFVLHLYVLLKMYPRTKQEPFQASLPITWNRKTHHFLFNGFLPIRDLVNEAIVDAISTNTQSVGQDDRTPEGLVLRELVEYCINIKELLDDKSQKRTQSYRDFDIEDLLSAKEFLNNVRAEINTNMLTSTREEEMLEAIGQSNAPGWKKNLLTGVIVTAASAAVVAMVLGAKDAIAEGTANAARVSTVPGQYYTNTDEFDQQPGFMGVDFGESPAPAPRIQVPYGCFGSRCNFGSNLDIPSRRRRRRRRPRPTFFDHTLTV